MIDFKAKLNSISKNKNEYQYLFKPLTEEELLEVLEESRKQVENGQVVKVDDVIDELRKKYCI